MGRGADSTTARSSIKELARAVGGGRVTERVPGWAAKEINLSGAPRRRSGMKRVLTRAVRGAIFLVCLKNQRQERFEDAQRLLPQTIKPKLVEPSTD